MPKVKTKKSVIKRFKITKTGKILRSHQLRSNHLRRHKSKSALRRHARPIQVNKADLKIIKKMMGV